MVESTLPPSASKDRVRSGWWYTWKTFESKIYPKIASPKAAIRKWVIDNCCCWGRRVFMQWILCLLIILFFCKQVNKIPVLHLFPPKPKSGGVYTTQMTSGRPPWSWCHGERGESLIHDWEFSSMIDGHGQSTWDPSKFLRVCGIPIVQEEQNLEFGPN